MITLITGQVGSGKTFHAVSAIMDALKQGRNVFTNVQMHVGKIDALGLKGTLYQFRDCILAKGDSPLTNDCGFLEKEGNERYKDALVVIDEATYWLPAGKCSEEVIRFLHRQRHSGIDVMLVCPDPDSLPAAIRRLVQYHIDIADWAVSVEKVLPFIPAPPFRMKKTRGGFKGPTVSMVPFTIDVKLAEYYDTTGGTFGMEPRSTSMKEVKDRKAKGWRALVSFCIGTGLFIALVCWIVGRIFSGGLFGSIGKTQVAATQQAPAVVQDIEPPAPARARPLPASAVYIGGSDNISIFSARGVFAAVPSDGTPLWFGTMEAATAYVIGESLRSESQGLTSGVIQAGPPLPPAADARGDRPAPILGPPPAIPRQISP